MESLGLMFGGRFAGARVLLTGHTGFKGSWLALWLTRLGAQLTGIALDPPTAPSHWQMLGLDIDDRRVDVRDREHLHAEIARCRPEIVFHLAAQPLVRASYADPVATWEVNVMGTVHLLDACRHVPGIRAVVVATSDKCYENMETEHAYREQDPLGGHDPYSASKAGAELVVGSYRRSFMRPAGGPLIATARAGNVVGGGDWAEDRLVPDAIRACASGAELLIRSPRAVRPWQHVLEPLAGYLALGERLLEGDAGMARSWNFGPPEADCLPVEEVLRRLQSELPGLRWRIDTQAQPHEAGLLRLDASLARAQLGWRGVWDVERALTATARWYSGWIRDRKAASASDLDAYIDEARCRGVAWTG